MKNKKYDKKIYIIIALLVAVVILVFLNKTTGKIKEPIGLPINIGTPDEIEEPFDLPPDIGMPPDTNALKEGYILYEDCKNKNGILTQIQDQNQNCPSNKVNLGRIYDVDCLCICCSNF
ncbi:MAG: hypothetical protein V1663_04480 [archaeon]